MKLKRLILRDFRNINEAEIEFSPDTTVFLGRNAMGKTNALEAIYMFSRCKSFRGSPDRELVRFGENGYYTELHIESGGRDMTLAFEYYEGGSIKRKRREKNGVRISNDELMGLFHSVIFTPDHMDLLKGSPVTRRSFIDGAISSFNRMFFQYLCRYNKLAAERGAMLKYCKENLLEDRSLFSVYNSQMAELAGYITNERQMYLSRLEAAAHEFDLRLSGGREELRISYSSEILGRDEMGEYLSDEELAARYQRRFDDHISREMKVGYNLCGVQRDDFTVYLNGYDTHDFGSQGQIRSAVLSLKLAEGRVSRDITGEDPVYLLDDVLSELDAGRRDFFFSGCTGQTVITSCEEMPDTAYGNGSRNLWVYGVREGRYERVKSEE